MVGILVSASTSWVVRASDHDDGELDLKGRNLNLTDLYVFREDWHSGNTDHAGNLILIMNTNPRSVAKQQYYFSTQARYEFHIKRVADKTAKYVSGDDVTLRFTFAAPTSVTSKTQAMTVTAIRDGVSTSTSVTTGGDSILTTPLGEANTENAITLGDSSLSVFAGLKEDPFFFDVEKFFTVRAAIATPPHTAAVNFSTSTTANATDFTAGYNVNAIVARVPLAFLKNGNTETAFDVWETISVPE